MLLFKICLAWYFAHMYLILLQACCGFTTCKCLGPFEMVTIELVIFLIFIPLTHYHLPIFFLLKSIIIFLLSKQLIKISFDSLYLISKSLLHITHNGLIFLMPAQHQSFLTLLIIIEIEKILDCIQVTEVVAMMGLVIV